MGEIPRLRLGSSDLEISRFGVGTAPLGSTPGWSIYWGPQDEADAIRAIHAAIEEGINWIDTAPFYGWGRAEEIIGRAVRSRRDRVLIFTKCGTMSDGAGGDYTDLSPDVIRRDLEVSLRRLQVDHVGLARGGAADRRIRSRSSRPRRLPAETPELPGASFFPYPGSGRRALLDRLVVRTPRLRPGHRVAPRSRRPDRGDRRSPNTRGGPQARGSRSM